MATFKRGLSEKALCQLAKLAGSQTDNWWKDLLALWGPSGTGKAERPLRLAVRNNYLNFYLRGQSVARVAFDRQNHPFVDVHVKYAFSGATEQAYARLTGADIVHPKNGHSATYMGASSLREWMARAAKWETAEKAEVERVVADNAGVIDLEMGLPAHLDQTAMRMDLVALELGAGATNIVFWEAKRITDARLKSKAGAPEVTEQVKSYHSYLTVEAHRLGIIKAYAEPCRLLKNFADWAGASGKPLLLDPLVRNIAKNPDGLDLDITPRLVIFGTEDQLSAPGWKAHQAKLVGEHRVPVLTIKTGDYRLNPPETVGGAAT